MGNRFVYFLSTPIHECCDILDKISRGEFDGRSHAQRSELRRLSREGLFGLSASSVNETEAVNHTIGYAKDVEHWQKDFEAMIQEWGGETYFYEHRVFFRMSKEALTEWFRIRHEKFVELASVLTLDDFLDRNAMDEFRTSVGLGRNDSMTLNNDFFEDFIEGFRHIEPNRWYLAEGVAQRGDLY